MTPIIICADCAMGHANGDFSGMDEWTERGVKEGMHRTGHVIVGDFYSDYSTKQCRTCLTSVPGARFTANLP